MTLLAPIALTGLILIPVLVVFYLFRPDPKRSGSTTYFLWAAAAPDSQGGTFANRLQNNPLLWLQILVILFLVLFLARPSTPWTSQAPRASRVILVIDRSASMACGGAFEKAKEKAQDAAESMLRFKFSGSHPEVMLIAVDSQPTVIVPFTKDLSQFEQGLDGLQQTDREDDLESMRPFFQSLLKAHKAKVWLLGDRLPKELQLPGLQFTSVAHKGNNNVGIVSFSVSPPRPEKGKKRPFLYARVENFSDTAQQRIFRLEKLDSTDPTRVEAKILERTLLLSAGAGQTLVENLPATRLELQSNSLFRLTIDVLNDEHPDLLPTDDIAFTVVPPFQSDKVVVATGPDVKSPFLIRAISASSGIRLVRASELLRETSPPPVDLLLTTTDAPPPPELRVRSRFVLAPPPGKGEKLAAKLKPALTNAQLVSDSGVEWTRHKVQLTNTEPPSADETVLLDTKSGPALTISGVAKGLPTLHWKFPLAYSSLPLSPGLPVVVGRFIDLYGRSSSVPVNGSLSTSGDLTRPAGVRWQGILTLEPLTDRASDLSMNRQVSETAALVASPPVSGIYELSSLESGQSGPLAANLFSYSEGKLQRDFEDQAFTADYVEESTEEIKKETRFREVELPFLILAFLLLCLEAFLFLKRGRP